MTYSLWGRAQGKTIFDCLDDWPKRCDLCGRRLKFGDYASIFVGHSGTGIVIHEICYQHGGIHEDCLRGADVNFGESKSWPTIWAGNLSNELSFWFRTAARFAWLVLTHSLHIVMHPVRYRRYRQWMRELGIE